MSQSLWLDIKRMVSGKTFAQVVPISFPARQGMSPGGMAYFDVIEWLKGLCCKRGITVNNQAPRSGIIKSTVEKNLISDKIKTAKLKMLPKTIPMSSLAFILQ